MAYMYTIKPKSELAKEQAQALAKQLAGEMAKSTKPEKPIELTDESIVKEQVKTNRIQENLAFIVLLIAIWSLGDILVSLIWSR